MDVTGPSTLPRGSKLTLSTSGAQGDVSATISFGGMSVSLTVKADTDGKATICFRLPAAFKGGVEVTLTDGQSSAGFGVLVF
ncbi:MAG: hypothetical protein V3W41_12325 [Planctomycetota bacterium]